MEEWQNGHDQPGYHYHQEQDKKRKPIETPESVSGRCGVHS